MTIALLVILAALLVYELVAIFTTQKGDTISEIVWATSTRRPLLPFVIGVIAGHLFWQRPLP